MEWINLPKYVRAEDELSKKLRAKVYRFKGIYPVVFICGKYRSKRRAFLKEYIERHLDSYFVFYAEDVWKFMSEHEGQNALLMERDLAQLSDVVIVIVESPGTFAELGAFSLLDELREKLLPILDSKFEEKESFINTGPIRWINSDSKYKPSIHTDFKVLVEAADELVNRIKGIPWKQFKDKAISADQIVAKPKHLLFLICDILAIIGPATFDQCSSLLEKILESSPKWDLETLLGLAVSLELIHREERAGQYLYSRPLSNGKLDSFQHREMFDLSRQRARFLSVIQTIPAARIALGLHGK